MNTNGTEDTPKTQFSIQEEALMREEELIVQQVLRISLQERSSTFFSKANGLPNNLHKKIPSMKMLRSKQTCTICFSPFVEDEKIKRLPCRHIFHYSCIKQWFKINKRCPVCRMDIEEYFKQLESQSINNPSISCQKTCRLATKCKRETEDFDLDCNLHSDLHSDQPPLAS